MLRGRPRNLGADFKWLIPHLPSLPSVKGAEHLARDRRQVIVGNHYQRPGLWMGWSAMLLGRAVFEHTGANVHWVAITQWRDYRLGILPVPPLVTQAIFARFYETFGFLGMAPEYASVGERAASVRHLLEVSRSGEVVGIFPEGDVGPTPALIQAVPGTGALLLRLAGRADIVPAAVYDGESSVEIRFGAAVDLEAVRHLPQESRDDEARGLVMKAVAALLPTRLKGVYG